MFRKIPVLVMASSVILSATPTFTWGGERECGPNDWMPKDMKTYHALVKRGTGNVKLLQDFHQFLQDSYRVADLEDQAIGCVQCPDLPVPGVTPPPGATPPTQLDYFFFRRHEDNRRCFAEAWHDVQERNPPHPEFTIQFDTQAPSPACSTQPQPCYTNPVCVSTGGCDRNLSQVGCQRCL